MMMLMFSQCIQKLQEFKNEWNFSDSFVDSQLYYEVNIVVDHCSTDKGLCEVANDTHVIKELTLFVFALVSYVGPGEDAFCNETDLFH